jgi:hypothetical protein
VSFLIPNSGYLRLGKEIIEAWLYPPVSRLINLLRVYYGQYWIPELAKWDSRDETLGSYCQHLGMTWSADHGDTWTAFVPDRPGQIWVVEKTRHLQFLTQKDWKTIESTVNAPDELSPAAFALARTHELRARGQIKNAFIEGITTLELALDEHMRRKLDQRKQLLETAQAFYKLPLKTKTAILVAQANQAVLDNLEFALRAIEIRNDIVHEGKSPPSDSAKVLSGLLCIITEILGQEFKFPETYPGNARSSAENWEKSYLHEESQ